MALIVAIIVLIVVLKRRESYRNGDTPYTAYDDNDQEIRRPLNPTMEQANRGGFFNESSNGYYL